jgi:hypothetical protein
MNFQKRLFIPPDIQDGNVYGSVKGNITMPNLNMTCIGERCCGDGTSWNPIYGNCSPASGFTLMNESNSVLPYVPFEFDSYAKI